MNPETEVVEKVVDILSSDGSYSRLKERTLADRGFPFDAVMTSDDPMSLVVIEHKQRADEKTLRDYVRQLRSLVWALFADGKRLMVSAVLILNEEISAASAAGLVKELSGTSRLFLVSKNMTHERIRAELISLLKPEFAKSPPKESSADRLLREISSVGVAAKIESAMFLSDLVKGSRSADEVSRQLVRRFKSLAKEVDDASAKPPS